MEHKGGSRRLSLSASLSPEEAVVVQGVDMSRRGRGDRGDSSGDGGEGGGERGKMGDVSPPYRIKSHG